MVGSRKLPTGAAVRTLTSFLLRLPRPPRLNLRIAKTGAMGQFEYELVRLCQMMDLMGLSWEFFAPNPDDVGRAGVFFRDIRMVADSDLVIALFPESDPMEGGTAHVVEKAQDQRVPVYAYTVDNELHLKRLGEWDPDEAWAHAVPTG